MHVVALDHVNIRTGDVDASARFYAELLGLKPGATPVPLPPDKARWLFDHAGHPIIHLFNGEFQPGSTGPIHHVALRCSGKAELIERLTRRGTHFDVHEASAELTLIFMRDPNGVLLELSFLGE
jgi:catechol 2,3-dioxygenase-like lactoylglutathione lyase family enzyme